MKILYITFSPLSQNSGHTARLNYTLRENSKINEVHVISLRKGKDRLLTRLNFRKVKFSYMNADFDNWTVTNSKVISKNIYEYCKNQKIDIVVVLMEVWDIVRELSNYLYKNIPMAVVFNSIPFVMSPNNPTGNFNSDIDKLLDSKIPLYKKEYIKKHRGEFQGVMSKIHVISPNKTVSSYFEMYFSGITVNELPSLFLAQKHKRLKEKTEFNFDLVYMARMEIGKGAEHLYEISKRTSLLLGRKIRLLIIGRPDDDHSKKEISDLNCLGSENNFVEVKFVGWLNNRNKKKYLLKSNIFIYPSLFDTYAVVVNEAISLGLPVIMWDSFFYQHSYKNMNFILSTHVLDFDRFAENIYYAIDNRDSIAKEISSFNKNREQPNGVIKEEIEIYERIIKYGKDQ